MPIWNKIHYLAKEVIEGQIQEVLWPSQSREKLSRSVHYAGCFYKNKKRRIKKWFNSYIFRLTTTLHRQLKVFRIFYKEQDNNAILKYVSDVNLHCPINILYNLRSWFKLNYIFMQITINISTVVQTTSKKLGTEAWILLMQWVKPLIWGIIEKKIISSVDSHHLLNLKGMCRYLVHLMIIM